MFGLRSRVNDVTGSTGKGNKEYRQNFGFKFQNDPQTTAGGSTQTGTKTPVVVFRVGAGQEYSWGYGAAKFEANQGYMSGEILDDEGEPVTGTFTLEQWSSTRRNRVEVKDVEADDLPADKNGSRATKEPLPEQDDFPVVTQDSYLALTFEPDSDAHPDGVTIDPVASDLKIPVTQYDVS